MDQNLVCMTLPSDVKSFPNISNVLLVGKSCLSLSSLTLRCYHFSRRLLNTDKILGPTWQVNFLGIMWVDSQCLLKKKNCCLFGHLLSKWSPSTLLQLGIRYNTSVCDWWLKLLAKRSSLKPDNSPRVLPCILSDVTTRYTFLEKQLLVGCDAFVKTDHLPKEGLWLFEVVQLQIQH